MQGINGLRVGMLLTLGLVLGCASGGTEQQVGAEEGRTMAAEWTQLRQGKGHFAGGEWRQDLDAWQGRKHQLMQALAAEVLAARRMEIDMRMEKLRIQMDTARLWAQLEYLIPEEVQQ